MDAHKKRISMLFSRKPTVSSRQGSWKSDAPSKGHPSYKVGDKTFSPGNMRNMGDYTNICKFLSTLTDIRCHICWSCSVSKVYDKNNKEYKVSRDFRSSERIG